MALYQVDNIKDLLVKGQREEFSNRYIIEVPTGDPVTQGALEDLEEIEKSVHGSNVRFLRQYWREFPFPAGGVSGQRIMSGTGSLSQGSAGTITFPESVVRCDFYPDSGRPSRKYLHTGRAALTGQDGDALLPDFGTIVRTNYVERLINSTGLNWEYVDVDGQALNQGRVFPYLYMHQFRRGSKRKRTPIGG